MGALAVFAGASHDSPRAQTCTFEGPGLQTPPKFNETTPKGRKNAISAQAILAQGHFADAGPVFLIWFSVAHPVSRWEGNANGFSRTASRTMCGKQFLGPSVRWEKHRSQSAPKLLSPKLCPLGIAVRQSLPRRSSRQDLEVAGSHQSGGRCRFGKHCNARRLKLCPNPDFQTSAINAWNLRQIEVTDHDVRRSRIGTRVSQHWHRERSLEELQSQEKSPFAGPVVDAETELVRLRAQVAELQGRAEMSITSVIPADAMRGSQRSSQRQTVRRISRKP